MLLPIADAPYGIWELSDLVGKRRCQKIEKEAKQGLDKFFTFVPCAVHNVFNTCRREWTKFAILDKLVFITATMIDQMMP